MKSKWDLMREEAVKATGKSIRELPLDVAYPEAEFQLAARSDLWKRILEYIVEVGVETNMFRNVNKRHIMVGDHSLCRKNSIATSYGRKIILKYKTWTMTFEKFRKNRLYNCSKCYKRFIEFHEKVEGI